MTRGYDNDERQAKLRIAYLFVDPSLRAGSKRFHSACWAVSPTMPLNPK